jgi:hypothetical protein
MEHMLKKGDKVKFASMRFPPWITTEIEKKEIYGKHVAALDVEQVLTVNGTSKRAELIWLDEDIKPQVGWWHECFELVEAGPELVDDGPLAPEVYMKGYRNGRSIAEHAKNPHLTTIDHYKKIIDSNTEKAMAQEKK